MDAGLVSPTTEGTPQGGPLSPLLSNILLDELDKELERRGHAFCRYADDGVPRRHEEARDGQVKVPAARGMGEGPPEPVGRDGLQTTVSCVGQEPRW